MNNCDIDTTRIISIRIYNCIAFVSKYFTLYNLFNAFSFSIHYFISSQQTKVRSYPSLFPRYNYFTHYNYWNTARSSFARGTENPRVPDQNESPPLRFISMHRLSISYTAGPLIQSYFKRGSKRGGRRKSRRKAHTEGGRPYIKGRLWPLLSLFMKAVSGQAPGAGGFGIKSRNSIS